MKLSDHLLVFPKGGLIDTLVGLILCSTTVSHELKDNILAPSVLQLLWQLTQTQIISKYVLEGNTIWHH